MSSEIAICQRVCIKLGAATISSLEEDDPKAVALKIAYPMVRDAEIRRRRWRFSLARGSFAAMVAAPDFGFAHKYQLPSDCLQIIQVGEFDLGANMSDYRVTPNELFSLEGRELLTDLGSPLKLRWKRRITDTALFDACFTEALASRLAYETCYRITQSDAREDRCLRDYKISIREGVKANMVEVAQSDLGDDTWIRARRG